MEKSPLAQARARKHWTLKEAADAVGVSLVTFSRWEQGQQQPYNEHIRRLCEVFDTSAVALGLDAHPSTEFSSDEANEVWSFLNADLTMRLLTLVFVPRSHQMVQREVTKFLEDNIMHDPITRREALRRLATLPIATLHLSAASPIVTRTPEAVLSQCGAGVVACWYLRKGKELSFANSTVSAYIPTLKEIVASSSQYRKAAADLLVQCYLLKTALSWNITTAIDGIAYAQQAERYSQIAEKPLLQVASLRAQAAVLSYANQWKQALHAGLQAKYLMEATPKEVIPPLASSYIYAGLATYYAYHGEKQEALTSLKKAHTTFFEQAEPDAVPLWIDHSIGNVLINDGLTHAYLGLYKAAVDSFGQIDKKYAHDVTIPFACRVQGLIEQVTAEVSRADQERDMELCIALWTQGIEGAKAMQWRVARLEHRISL